MGRGHVPPGREVLRAFGLTGDPVPLAGGQGTSVAVDGAVLKPVPDGGTVEAEWCAEVLGALREDGFRVARPIRAPDGGHVFGGWTACWRVDGGTDPDGRWPDLLATGRAFNAALRGVARPDFLGPAAPPRHRWALADRVAWAEATVGYSGGSAVRPLPPVERPLRALLRLRERAAGLPGRSGGDVQLVHGDLAGNTLFAPGLPPAVIDFSPYWRPPEFAEAIAVVDGLVWLGAGPELVGLSVAGPAMLVRAAIFRLVASNERAREVGPSDLAEVDLFEPVVDLLDGLVRAAGRPG